MLETLQDLKEWLEDELYQTELHEMRQEVIEDLGMEGWQKVLVLALENLSDLQ
ncbi:MAG: hypothetical protein J6Q39_06040 [Bacteroidales bacterium]|jgi:hypothetical protein|nr:hypothetical protein [Bacteroidales bacterium]